MIEKKLLEQRKFSLKIYIKYLIASPFTEKISLPNPRTTLWIVIFLSLLFRWSSSLIIFLIMQVILYLYYEYKSGIYMYWYRQRKFREQREALKRIRKERKERKERNIQEEKEKENKENRNF